MNEYKGAYERVAELATAIEPERWREAGTIEWYDPEYALDDLMVYQYYGHKREHAAQIDAFLYRLGSDAS